MTKLLIGKEKKKLKICLCKKTNIQTTHCVSVETILSYFGFWTKKYLNEIN